MRVPRGSPLEVRFAAYVERGPRCWAWTGQRDKHGYGRIKLGGRPVSAHRVSWMLHRGPIPDGLCVLHRCDNPPCVNPDHLFLGTADENTADKVAKGRSKINSGEKNPSSRLREAEVLDIVRIYRAGGINQTNLAARFGIAQTSVSSILTGRTWRKITGCSDGR